MSQLVAAPKRLKRKKTRGQPAGGALSPSRQQQAAASSRPVQSSVTTIWGDPEQMATSPQSKTKRMVISPAELDMLHTSALLSRFEDAVFADVEIPLDKKDSEIFTRFLNCYLAKFTDRPSTLIVDFLGPVNLEWPMSKKRFLSINDGVLATRRAQLDKEGGLDRLEQLIDRELRRVCIQNPDILLNDWQGCTKDPLPAVVHAGKAVDTFCNEQIKKAKYSYEELVAYCRSRLQTGGILNQRFRKKGFGNMNCQARWSAGYFIDVKGKRVERGWFEGDKEGGLRNIKFPRLRIFLE